MAKDYAQVRILLAERGCVAVIMDRYVSFILFVCPYLSQEYHRSQNAPSYEWCRTNKNVYV